MNNVCTVNAIHLCLLLSAHVQCAVYQRNWLDSPIALHLKYSCQAIHRRISFCDLTEISVLENTLDQHLN